MNVIISYFFLCFDGIMWKPRSEGKGGTGSNGCCNSRVCKQKLEILIINPSELCKILFNNLTPPGPCHPPDE